MLRFLCHINADRTETISISSEYFYQTEVDENSLILKISKNDNYITNFYSKEIERKIDLTAIVGQNSSGKTFFLKECFYLDGINIFFETENNTFIVATKEKVNIRILFEGEKIESDALLLNQQNYDFRNIFFSNSFEPKTNNRYEKFTNNISLVTGLNQVLINNNSLSLSSYVNDSMSKQAAMLNSLQGQSNTQVYDSISEMMKIPQELLVSIKEVDFNKYEFNLFESIDYFFDFGEDLYQFLEIKSETTSKMKQELVKKAKIKFLTENLNYMNLEQIFENIRSFNNKSYGDNNELLLLEESINLIEDELHFLNEKNEKQTQIINREKNKNFFNHINSKTRTYVIFDEIYWCKISSGQYNLLNFFEKIYFLNVEHIQSINLFIDEPDLGLHPEWQRKWVYYIPNIIFEIIKNHNQFFKSLQIVFATHSPIMLSDLRKFDVNLFYDDSKSESEDDSKSESEDESENEKIEMGRTFGANINDLISESFFLDGGLMGEYSQFMINELIKNLDNADENLFDEVPNKSLQFLIEEIGEVYLRKSLKEKYSVKFFKQNKKELIEDKILSLKKELAELELEGNVDD